LPRRWSGSRQAACGPQRPVCSMRTNGRKVFGPTQGCATQREGGRSLNPSLAIALPTVKMLFFRQEIERPTGASRTGYRLQATGYRLQATGYRLQTADWHCDLSLRSWPTRSGPILHANYPPEFAQALGLQPRG
jgi:hypothetical protein